MRITLIGEELGSLTSGQSRFLLNLAKGLRAEGVQVGVAASMITPEARLRLESIDVRVRSCHDFRERSGSKAALLAPGSRVGREVALCAVRSLEADWYVVLADAAVDAGLYLPHDHSVYLSNGDLGLLLLSQSFFRTHRLAKSLLGLGASRLIRAHASAASRYHIRLANSDFTRGIMTYLYSLPFTGVVYPPVDLDFFKPLPETHGHEEYATAICRNENEEGYPLLTRIAQRLPIHVVGGAKILGATSLSVVSDELLRTEYSRARFLVFPVFAELFGYAVAESLACGTPVVAFDSGGPAEQITDGVNGWLVSTEAEALERATSIFASGPRPSLRTAARESAARFSLSASARALIAALVG